MTDRKLLDADKVVEVVSSILLLPSPTSPPMPSLTAPEPAH